MKPSRIRRYKLSHDESRMDANYKALIFAKHGKIINVFGNYFFNFYFIFLESEFLEKAKERMHCLSNT